ncbi:hypothetical protein C4K19_4025 [Pseudomonas chlororaphis subsp. aurantiaca]|uniref:pyridoxal phosphate-dependent aminotransferase n=1 Tax=Pseudomonas chlororaphis TaxID=587753 RepID=UPI000F561849|nr:pyridoxal phosphate-dependent aminotransferase [Pseudomonas chlororaphis]AZD55808.1 hypothetical protein C4K19_4025 [Pseudomonas chlororaphis subsp. aurantiaca]
MRDTVPALQAAVQDFCVTLNTVRQESNVAGSARLELEALLRGMFGAFRDARGATALGLPTWYLPASYDNLDTGNAWHPPYPRYSQELQYASTDLELARQYMGPEALRELVQAACAYARNAKLVPEKWSGTLGVLAGTGTVQLYDVLTRLLIERPNDGVVVPTPTYGFFLPQIERAGGDIIPLPLSPSGRVSAQQLRDVVEKAESQRWSQWRSEICARITLARLRWPQADIYWDKLKRELLRAESPFEADAILSTYGAPRGRVLYSMLSPPRVVALFHINPQVNGLVYGSAQVDALSDVLVSKQMAVIEDLAYHGLILRENATVISSFLSTSVPTYSLLGLSKPFALAGHRIGILLTSEPLEPLQRLVESSAGFVPPASQLAAAAVLGAPSEHLASYLDAANNDPDEGYAIKRRIMLMLLKGRHTGNVLPYEREAILARLHAELAEVAMCLDVTKQACEQFLDEGLSRLVELAHDPEMGIFILVSCKPCIDLAWAKHLGVKTSFDFFAWAAYFCGVRTIPEESMGSAWQDAHLLRLSLSPAVGTLVKSAFLLWFAARRFEDSYGLRA